MATSSGSVGYQNDITVAILEAIENDSLLRTPLARKANVHYETMARYIEHFLQAGLVEELSDKSLRSTEKGKAFLAPLKQAMAIQNGGGN